MEVLRVQIEHGGYSEKEPIIEGIDFSVHSGELVGLLGPNGAGKSTTIKSIIGTLEHVEGEVVYDRDRRYAYIPEQPIFYEELTLWEHIQFTASVCGLSENEMVERVEPLLKTFRLDDVRHHLPTTFSKGMQQKLMIILAFLAQPQLYIVDEPFVGLDPKATNDFLRLLKRERERGAGVLMSTHMLDTAERICERFVLIINGGVIAKGTLDEIRNEHALGDKNLYDCFEILLEKNGL
ncbi:ABC transporter ATP-binding protein [Bacillaceae bacterium W0354]